MENFNFNNLVSVNKEMKYSVLVADTDFKFEDALKEAMEYVNSVDDIDDVILVFDGLEVAIKKNSTLESLVEVYEFKKNHSKSYNIKRDDFTSTLSGVDKLVEEAIKKLQFTSEGSGYEAVRNMVMSSEEAANIEDLESKIESSISKLYKGQKIEVYEEQFFHIEELKNVYKNKLRDYSLSNIHQNVFNIKIGDSSHIERNNKLNADLDTLAFIEMLTGIEPAEMNHITRLLLFKVNEKYEQKITKSKKFDEETKRNELDALEETFYVGKKLVSRATLLDEKHKKIK